VRFNDPAQHELLSLVADERHTSVNQLIQDLIDAPLHEAAGEREAPGQADRKPVWHHPG
jgi:hypothetical protein